MKNAYMVDRDGGSPESFSPFYNPVVLAASEAEAKAKYLVWYKENYGYDNETPDELVVVEMGIVE